MHQQFKPNQPAEVQRTFRLLHAEWFHFSIVYFLFVLQLHAVHFAQQITLLETSSCLDKLKKDFA